MSPSGAESVARHLDPRPALLGVFVTNMPGTWIGHWSNLFMESAIRLPPSRPLSLLGLDIAMAFLSRVVREYRRDRLPAP